MNPSPYQSAPLGELPKAYESQQYEAAIYQRWEDSGLFNPDKLPGDRPDTYAIMMPPPNVTGVLHLGHALENAILDAKIRFERMRGKRAVLVPGTDHAAVATQARVEKDLVEQGMQNPREALGRDMLLERIRVYAEQSKATILSQIRKLGTSCDWDRLAYTFDEQRSNAVYAVFKKMYDDELIYRGYRVVNWSVKGQSTCSDDELVYIERPAKLYTLRYGKDFPIPIATTRPETKLGDTAVAVHPDDPRYQQYIGQIITVDVGAQKPLQIKVVGDKEVDPQFGTGAVGITPAHSMIDYEMKERHNLELIPVIGTDGRMTEAAGKDYAGLTVVEAREKFVEYLKREGLLISMQDIQQNAATSDRFGDVVEVVPMLQWFVGVNRPIPSRDGKTLKDLMREYGQQISIIPERFNNIYFQWIENLHDWCISRQIWWGHRLPVWYCTCGEVTVSDAEPTKPCFACGKHEYRPETDTLDTWFSSGTWTFSTLGYPTTYVDDHKTGDLATFHPTAWMQMGYELVFFWMARMILMSGYILDEVPFKEVYIHGLVRDEQGRKFSKSLRNTIDPLDMIAKYGADALRMSLLIGTTPGNDLTFYEKKVEHYQHFVNKVWNVSRYILSTVDTPLYVSEQPEPMTSADSWILDQWEQLTQTVTASLENSNFSYAANAIYEFTWHALADKYIEAAKLEVKTSPDLKKTKDAILLYLLGGLLRIAHPFIPFVTEVLWERFDTGSLLMVGPWPLENSGRPHHERGRQFDQVQIIKEKIQEYRRDRNVPLTAEPRLRITGNDSLYIYYPLIQMWARVKIDPALEHGDEIPMTGCTVLIDYRAELAEKKKEELRAYITQLEAKLSSDFASRAPAAVVEQERQKLKEAKEKLGEA